jgi:hypothetical protein
MRVNVNNQYVDVDLSVDDLEKIQAQSSKDNRNICDNIYKISKDDLPNEIIAVLCQQATQHWIFRAENYAKLVAVEEIQKIKEEKKGKQ